jgi:uncharacterized protein involved in exopolysaccharide biosynthesis
MARYVETLLRYWVRFVVLLIIAPLVLGAGSAFLLRTYQASASLWIEAPNYFGQTVTPAGWNTYLTPAQNESDALNELLSTHAFVSEIGDRLWQQGAVKDDAQLNTILDSFATRLKVEPQGAHLVTLTFSNESKAVCTAVLQVTITHFREYLTASQKDQASISQSFLTDQLSAAKVRYDASQAAVTKYAHDHNITTTEVPSSITQPEFSKLFDQAQQDKATVEQLTAQLNSVNLTSAEAQQLVEKNTQTVDQPRLTKAGLLGDGSSVKRAALISLACVTLGLAYLLLLVWVDKTARDARELDNRFKVPVLATIPRIGLLEPLS